jgi:hypothetical protein
MRTTQWYRLMMSCAVLFCVLCLSVVHVDARGGRGGGGRGGHGGFSGGRGGSVRQSRNVGRSSGRSNSVSRQPARTPSGGGNHGSVRQSDGRANSRVATGGRYESFGRRDTSPSQGSGSAKRYTNTDLKGAAKPGQQAQKKIASSGPTASQLPTKDRSQLREGRRRDDSRLRPDQKRRLRRNARREWYEDRWDGYYGYYPWWYGYPVTTVSYSYYVKDSPPCKTAVVVDETEGRNTYYYCNATWYQPVTSSTGTVKYVVTTPPARAELISLSNPSTLNVDGKEYYLSGHVFYQKIKRDGKDIYVTVDAPVGAKVATIPEYAVEVEHKGKQYFCFGQIFYKKQADGFVVVKNPG